MATRGLSVEGFRRKWKEREDGRSNWKGGGVIIIFEKKRRKWNGKKVDKRIDLLFREFQVLFPDLLGIFILLFLSVFLGVFGSMAQSEHYAFIKISQFFSALNTTGRIDLLFSYLLTVLLIFYTCLPVQLAKNCFAQVINTRKNLIISIVLNVALFVFVLFCNNFYNSLYGWISVRLAPIFLLFSYLLPIAVCLVALGRKNRKQGGRVALNAKKTKLNYVKRKGYEE